MGKITGRSDDMLIIRGVNVFPSQIEEILIKSEGVEPHYQIIVERDGSLDTIEVQVEDEGTGFSPEEIPDPLAPENLLKAYGRGIFFMKQFMDEVTYSFPKKGGTVVRMLKKVPAA